MALKLIGTSQNSTNQTLDAATSPWATWSIPTVPWIKKESDSSGITLHPGQYRVEPLGGMVRYWSVDNSIATDITSPAVVGGGTLRAYSSKNPAQNVIITRLA